MKQIFILIAAFVTFNSYGQADQRKSPHDTVSSDLASVTYGRPYKKGRDIFGSLEKYDKVWRVGADEATTITFTKDVKFGDKEVKAGTYTLFAIPKEKEWTIILNSERKQWGAYGYEKIKAKDVAHVNAKVNSLDAVVEQLTLRFDKKNTLVIEWDKTQVVVPIKAK